MNMERVNDIVKEIQMNRFCLGGLLFPKEFYNLTKEEKAEVCRKIKEQA